MKAILIIPLLLMAACATEVQTDNVIKEFEIAISLPANASCSIITVSLENNWTDDQTQGVIYGMLSSASYTSDNIYWDGTNITIQLTNSWCDVFVNRTRTYKSINDITLEDDCIDDRGNCWISFDSIEEELR